MPLKTSKKNKPKDDAFTVKVSLEDRQAIKRQAYKYTHGNISEWMRYAAKHHTPKKEELK